MTHPALVPGQVAVVIGGAAGIGRAAAEGFAKRGLHVCIADRDMERLAEAEAAVRAAGADHDADVMTHAVDVADVQQVITLESVVRSRFGGTDVLMNNAGVQPGSHIFGPAENWRQVIGINLWGAIHGTQTFVPKMLERSGPGLVINTGSKQGITTPPGDPAYNTAKAGLKAFTEALAHELRNTDGCELTAHLLIPGFVFTQLTRPGETEKPESAWTPEQTADFMFDRLDAGDFYILCPDNDVPRWLDEKRMQWAIGDIVENRPPLSRWHPDYADAFKAFVNDGAKG
ncbi:SDR family oxidoreductase [Salinisphaera sp. LB1]|uniref:SDR family NAD(P)-dependent oxidoreductase n=1 Tax=Salinisphaera sp. LB1 TaxID=2183911 RepID=UPI000D708482|nr:SDR family NAD(P)-dependent oxidoreductase [Salinisphaera sp. LB1]AWN15385.1 Oxidoreductase [Salinisphaera sp. LB1]